VIAVRNQLEGNAYFLREFEEMMHPLDSYSLQNRRATSLSIPA
jgi:hypothetical protein